MRQPAIAKLGGILLITDARRRAVFRFELAATFTSR